MMNVKANIRRKIPQWKIYALNVRIFSMDMKIVHINLKMGNVFTVIGIKLKHLDKISKQCSRKVVCNHTPLKTQTKNPHPNNPLNDFTIYQLRIFYEHHRP